MPLQNMFLHHVFFWLNHPESEEDRSRLIEGLKKLTAVKTIRQYHIGEPAKTHRDVIDRSYSVSWFLAFDDAPSQESYQVDPIHLNFVRECSHLWSRVLVYDSVSGDHQQVSL